jgi:hypothetical protein
MPLDSSCSAGEQGLSGRLGFRVCGGELVVEPLLGQLGCVSVRCAYAAWPAVMATPRSASMFSNAAAATVRKSSHMHDKAGRSG